MTPRYARFALGFMAAAPSMAALDLTFDRLVQTGDTIPGSAATYTNLSRATVSNGNFSWYGAGAGVAGIYKQVGGVNGVVAQSGDPIPGGSGNWSTGSFTNSLGKIDGNDVAFRAGNGLYASFGGAAPVRVADTTMVNPATGSNFPNFQQPYISNGNVGFAAGSSGAASGVALYSGGSLTGIWAGGTALPSPMVGGITLMGNGVYKDGVFAQQVFDSDFKQGILTNRNGSLEMVAHDYQNVPGQSFAFTQFLDPTLEGDYTSFIAWGPNGSGPGGTGFYKGLFRDDNSGSPLEVIADTNTVAPEVGTTFKDFVRGPALFGDTVLFEASTSGTGLLQGIYALYNGQLERIIDTSFTLDGKTITSLDMNEGALFAENEGTFLANFSDGSKGIYTFTIVPEPASLGLLSLGAVALLRRRK